MKLWDSLTTCLVLLSAVRAGRLLRRRGRASETPLETPPVRVRISVSSPGIRSSEADSEGWEETLTTGEQYTMDEFEDMVDFIKVTIGRIRRSSSTLSSSTSSSTPSKVDFKSRTRHRRERKKGARGGGRGGRGGGQGCVLKQIQLNVTDLGLGYRSDEEMIFRYCSGPCRKSETNYDKILYNLLHNKRLPPKERPPQACCRPIAFDDDLSFLDDNLVYHTVRKHSARKCACV